MFLALRVLAVASGVSLLFGCAGARPPLANEATPGIVFPHHIAEGKGGGSELPDPRSAPPAPAPAPEPAPPAPTLPAQPDPEALRSADQVEYTFTYTAGVLKVERARLLHFRDPIVTARKMGRFAVELWVGHELVERVRFDFPMLAAEDDPQPERRRRPLHEPVSLAGGTLRATVLVPNWDRARRALLLDRATLKELPLVWPPVPVAAPPVAAPSANP